MAGLAAVAVVIALLVATGRPSGDAAPDRFSTDRPRRHCRGLAKTHMGSGSETGRSGSKPVHAAGAVASAVRSSCIW